jgi:ATP-dependent Clp protease ATP-binding subunit ClpA
MAAVALRFAFKCLAVRHVNRRVTLTPIDFPELAVHAADLERATEELVLALDDKISRAHPRRVVDYARPPAGDPLPVETPLIKVWTGYGETVAPLRVSGLRAPAHRPYVEFRAPRLDLRFWLADPKAAAVGFAAEVTALVRAHLQTLGEHELLALRAEGEETFLEVAVEVTPLRLSDLKRRELHLDERSAVAAAALRRREEGRDPEDEEQLAEEGDDAAADDDDDDWEVDPRRKKKRPPTARKPRRVPTPTLQRLGTPLHRLARRGELEPAFERDALVAELRGRLVRTAEDREPREAVVLVGPAGAGKSAVIRELCRALAAAAAASPAGGDAAPPVYLIDGGRLIAGEGFLGDWQSQVLAAVREAREANAILCVGHVVELLDAGKTAHSEQNVSQLLAPVLAAREVSLMAEATTEEWARVEQRNAGFARLWSAVRVDDPEPESTRRILARVAEELGREHDLTFAPEVVPEVLSLCARFRPYGAQVGNATSFLRRLAGARDKSNAARLGPVRAVDAIGAFAAECGVPERLLRDDLPLDPPAIRAFLEERVKGQPAAVERVASVVSVIKANLADRKRPAAVLLFVGPTGVGKTELCKALGELVFGDRDRLVRLDMGEYGGADALGRLIGEGGLGHLTSAVRRQPFSVVLLDEIEKAHPAVFDALLGVLGEGRLTDGRGRLTDFRSTVFVLTSNIGTATWRAAAGFFDTAGPGAAAAHYRAEVRRFFRPELYNRLDDVVVFSPLGESEIDRIIGRELERVAGREGLRRREVDLVVDGEGRRLLTARGVDPRYGARPLRRVIERQLVAPVAEYLAAHPARGVLRLTASASDGEIVLRSESPGRAEAPSRAAIRRLLARAAAVRAEIGRWARSAPMTRVRHDMALFDRESSHPAFWDERALAEERARAVASGRELWQAFESARALAEAAEDLAYEAYFTRRAQAVDALEADLGSLEAEQVALAERVYLTLFPRAGQATLILWPGRSGWADAVWLMNRYATWVQGRGGSVAVTLARPVEVETLVDRRERPAQAPSAAAAARRKAVAPIRWRAEKALPDEDDPAPIAAALSCSGFPAVVRLAGEHGAHRFTAASTTALVKVSFEPRARRLQGEYLPEEWEKLIPTAEVRRVWRGDKNLLEDRAMSTRYDISGRWEMDGLLDDYLHYRVFGAVRPGGSSGGER